MDKKYYLYITFIDGATLSTDNAEMFETPEEADRRITEVLSRSSIGAKSQNLGLPLHYPIYIVKHIAIMSK